VQSPDALASFHPLVAGWFRERFGEPTAPQRSRLAGDRGGAATR
jgi:Lhr-like helicase